MLIMQSMTTFVKEKETKKVSTLREIAPNWARRFEESNTLPFPFSLTWLKWFYELDHPSKCVVGEAHGYRPTYQKECNECDRLGWEFGGSFLSHSRQGLQRNVEAFLNHWNEKHFDKEKLE